MSLTLAPVCEQIAGLPLWAQVLVASRAVRRAVLAGAGQNETRILMRALDAIDSCIEFGYWERHEERALLAASARRDRGERETRAIREAAYWAVDACLAAESARDFPSDGSVTQGVDNALLALAQDRRFSPAEVLALAVADLDLIRSSIREFRLMTYAPVPASILARLPRISALPLAA